MMMMLTVTLTLALALTHTPTFTKTLTMAMMITSYLLTFVKLHPRFRRKCIVCFDAYVKFDAIVIFDGNCSARFGMNTNGNGVALGLGVSFDDIADVNFNAMTFST